MKYFAAKLFFTFGLIAAPIVSSANVESSVNETADEIDRMIDEDDRRQVGHRIGFEHFNINPHASACAMRIEVLDLNAVLENTALRDRYLRMAGFECRKNLDFSLNPYLKNEADIALARDAFTCSIVNTIKGIPSERHEQLVGMAGTLTRDRLFLPDKVTEFDNRRLVVTETEGRNPKIDINCSIHPRRVERREIVQAFRLQWKVNKDAENERELAMAAAREQKRKEKLEELKRSTSVQFVQLNEVLLGTEKLNSDYEKCLSSYRIGDKLYRKLQVAMAEPNSKSGALTCDQKKKKLVEWTAVAPERLKADSFFELEAVYSHQGYLLSLDAEKSCREQLEICRQSSIVGNVTDLAIKEAPGFWQRVKETANGFVDKK